MKKILEYDFPKDLKSMSYHELDLLAIQIREFILDKVSKTGGHLASNLGIVELTISLHKVFDSPKDKFVFDVGHQAYIHKILTGRAKDFDTLRKHNGLSGFPKRNESIHDKYDTGHSSTSLSAIYGMARARDIKGEDYNVISIIGDGSMTGGQCFEALNNIGESKTRAIVILNDNGMSISKNVGGLSKHLTRLRTSKGYISTKEKVKEGVKSTPKLYNSLKNFKNNVKYSLLDREGVIFEELGFTYLGPVDGHNIPEVCEVLEKAKKLNEPVIVHVKTTKGKGYKNAENNPSKFHGIGPFNVETGVELKKKIGNTYSEVSGELVHELAKNDIEVCAITAAMGDSVGLCNFEKDFPNRFFDVGIAEQHAVSFSAGLAVSKMKPYVFIYSSFLQRAYDQIVEDVSLQKLNVTFMIDRAGLVGADGETHNGVFDLSYLLPIPYFRIYCPYDKETLKKCVDFSHEYEGPVAIRYPRGECKDKIEIPKITHEKICILATGKMVSTSLIVKEELKKENINCDIVAEIRIKPIDLDYLKEYEYVFTLEDNVLIGGFGEYVKSELENSTTKVFSFGWPDKFIEHGTFEELSIEYGLDPISIKKKIMEFIK